MEISTPALFVLAAQGVAVLLGVFLTIGCFRGIIHDRNASNDSKI